MARPEWAMRQEARQPGPDPAAHRAAARGRASSLTSAFPLPLPRDTGHDSPSWFRRLLAVLAIPPDLVNVPPKALSQAHAHHQAAAAQWNAWLGIGFRTGWGWLHLSVKAVLHAVDWTFESPIRFLVAAVIVTACVFWL